jgi:hypothetical protein
MSSPYTAQPLSVLLHSGAVLIYDIWPQSRYASPTHITAELIKIMGTNKQNHETKHRKRGVYGPFKEPR